MNLQGFLDANNPKCVSTSLGLKNFSESIFQNKLEFMMQKAREKVKGKKKLGCPTLIP